MSVPDGYEVAWRVGTALETAGVDYFLGGSLASSLQGPPRFTQDIDFGVHLRVSQLPGVVSALGPDFDVDAVALEDAIRRKRSWNIFHLPTATRIDLFIVGDSEFDAEELARRQRREVGGGHSLWVKSPEDTVLRKLMWFKEGGELNLQQFRDVIGVLQYQRGALSEPYLDRWAPLVGVAELLRRARQAALDGK